MNAAQRASSFFGVCIPQLLMTEAAGKVSLTKLRA